jgi:chromosome segregation ATPase
VHDPKIHLQVLVPGIINGVKLIEELVARADTACAAEARCAADLRLVHNAVFNHLAKREIEVQDLRDTVTSLKEEKQLLRTKDELLTMQLAATKQQADVQTTASSSSLTTTQTKLEAVQQAARNKLASQGNEYRQQMDQARARQVILETQLEQQSAQSDRATVQHRVQLEQAEAKKLTAEAALKTLKTASAAAVSELTARCHATSQELATVRTAVTTAADRAEQAAWVRCLMLCQNLSLEDAIRYPPLPQRLRLTFKMLWFETSMHVIQSQLLLRISYSHAYFLHAF